MYSLLGDFPGSHDDTGGSSHKNPPLTRRTRTETAQDLSRRQEAVKPQVLFQAVSPTLTSGIYQQHCWGPIMTYPHLFMIYHDNLIIIIKLTFWQGKKRWGLLMISDHRWSCLVLYHETGSKQQCKWCPNQCIGHLTEFHQQILRTYWNSNFVNMLNMPHLLSMVCFFYAYVCVCVFHCVPLGGRTS